MEKDLGDKYPKLASNLNYFKEVWAETFPNRENELSKKMEQRKKFAKQIREQEEREKEMTPEEIEAMEANIPEWKKNAIVVSEERIEEVEKGVLGRMSQKMKDKISKTEQAQKFYQSEDYEKIKAMRNNYKEFKDNLKDGMENSQNPAV